MDTQGDIDTGRPETMRLRVAFLHWVACLGIFVILLALAIGFSSSFLGWVTFFVYMGAGIYLNRSVLRKLIEWHPMYNTLYNVTSAKLKFFLFWPLTYFFLFMRLGINKVL